MRPHGDPWLGERGRRRKAPPLQLRACSQFTLLSEQWGGQSQGTPVKTQLHQHMMEKHVVPPHPEASLSHEKERSPDTHNHVDGPRTRRSVRGADTEGHTGCDSTDGKRPEQAGLWCPEYLTGTVSNLEDEKVPGRWGQGKNGCIMA